MKISFDREELASASETLNIPRIKNLGDIVYSYRFRKDLPDAINETAQTGCEWIIMGAGIGSYEFRLSQIAKIEPAAEQLVEIIKFLYDSMIKQDFSKEKIGAVLNKPNN